MSVTFTLSNQQVVQVECLTVSIPSSAGKAFIVIERQTPGSCLQKHADIQIPKGYDVNQLQAVLQNALEVTQLQEQEWDSFEAFLDAFAQYLGSQSLPVDFFMDNHNTVVIPVD